MKKFINFVLASFCAIILCGCKNHKEGVEQSEELNNLGIVEKIQQTEGSNSASKKLNISKRNENLIEEIFDYKDCFDGMKGCAVFYSPDENKYTFYNKDMCDKQVSPCSTFKIVSTLMGLKNGVISSEDSKMEYNGTQYPIDEWNSDLRLQEAFQTSCVWYFRKVIDKVGKDEVQKELDTLVYGNCDISEWEGSGYNPLAELNGFWLESSLKISPKEQVDILYSIFSGESEYSSDDIGILKNIMKIDHDHGDKFSLYGKTGTGTTGNAWFTGFFTIDESANYFAVYLKDDDKSNVSGKYAKEIAQNIIRKYY